MRTSISVEESVTPNTGGTFAVSLPVGNSVRTDEPGAFWDFWADRYQCLVQQVFRSYREMYAHHAAGCTYYPLSSPTTRLLLSTYKPAEVQVGTQTVDEYIAATGGDLDAAERAFLSDMSGSPVYASAEETSRRRALSADASFPEDFAATEVAVSVSPDAGPSSGGFSFLLAALGAGLLMLRGTP